MLNPCVSTVEPKEERAKVNHLMVNGLFDCSNSTFS